MEERGESSRQRTKRSVCAYYNTTPKGCTYGDRCRYLHLPAPGLGEGEEQTMAESTSPNDRHFTDSGSRGVPPRGRGRGPGRSSQQQGEGRRRRQNAEGKSNRGTEPGSQSRSGPLGVVESNRPVHNPLHSLLDFPQLGSRHHHHAPVQSHIHQPTSSALTGNSASTTSRGRGRGRGQQHRPTSEFSLSALLESTTSRTSRPPCTRPSGAPDSGLCDLLATELHQLQLRFSGDRLSLVEKSACRQTYRLRYSPTDPDWPFSFKEVFLLVTFPQHYPKEVCSVTLEEGSTLLDTTVSHVNETMKDQLLAMRQSLGGRALLLRPFLKWLDCNIGQLILDASDGAGDGEGSGEILSLGHDQVDEAIEASDSDSSDSDSTGESEESDRDDKDDDGVLLTAPRMVKHGTEVRMRGLQVSPEVGLIQCSLMKTTLLCRRCKEHMDMLLKPDKVLESSCPRCGVSYGVHYTPSTVHPDCLTLGFLDLKDCLVHDVILFGSELTIVCLSCNKMTHTKGVHYGQPHTLWCQHCHQKMTVGVETCRLLEHESGPALQLTGREGERKEKRKKEFRIREGRPLPGRGTCDHYKKSCRWLRFPCCGKAYPCDVCHDSKEDHSYERASRMVCGFCAKEQTYTVDKPCVACKSALTGGPNTAYWEGGQGCRNKARMSRNDPRKYANMSKTGSKKMERVGFQGKMKALSNE